jgi:hypothetical protein
MNIEDYLRATVRTSMNQKLRDVEKELVDLGVTS